MKKAAADRFRTASRNCVRTLAIRAKDAPEEEILHTPCGGKPILIEHQTFLSAARVVAAAGAWPAPVTTAS